MQAASGAPLSADPTSPSAGAAAVDRRQLYGLSAVVAVVTLVADQLTKLWALHTLTPGDPIPVLGDLLRLNLIRNSGAAFSLGNGSTWVMTLMAVVVSAGILLVARRLGSRGWAWALGMMLGGSVGNLVDRMVRPPGPFRGHVVDFIDYRVFIGNVADIAIVAGAILILLLTVRGIGVDGSRENGSTKETRDA